MWRSNGSAQHYKNKSQNEEKETAGSWINFPLVSPNDGPSDGTGCSAGVHDLKGANNSSAIINPNMVWVVYCPTVLKPSR